MGRHRILPFKPCEMIIAAGFPFRLLGIEVVHLAAMKRGMQIAEPDLTIDIVGLDPGGDEIDCFHACLPGDIRILGRQLAADLGKIAGPALAQMAAVAAGSAGADPPGLENGDAAPRLGQRQRRRNAGQAAADDGDIGLRNLVGPRIARPLRIAGLVDAGFGH